MPPKVQIHIHLPSRMTSLLPVFLKADTCFHMALLKMCFSFIQIHSEGLSCYRNSYFYTDWFLPSRLPKLSLVTNSFLEQNSFQSENKHWFNTHTHRVFMCSIHCNDITQKGQSIPCMEMRGGKAPTISLPSEESKKKKLEKNPHIETALKFMKIHFQTPSGGS